MGIKASLLLRGPTTDPVICEFLTVVAGCGAENLTKANLRVLAAWTLGCIMRPEWCMDT